MAHQVETNTERITTAGVMTYRHTIFVAKRTLKGAVGGLWEFPGGKHRWGETPKESLRREFKEEFQIEVEVGSCFHTHDFIYRDTLYHLQAYWITSGNSQTFSLVEHDEIKWVTLEQLAQLDMVPSDQPVRETLNKLLTGCGWS